MELRKAVRIKVSYVVLKVKQKNSEWNKGREQHKPLQSVLGFLTRMRHSWVLFCCFDKMRDGKKEHDETVTDKKEDTSKEDFE